MGPIGQLLEPTGSLSFEEAYDIFKEEVIAGRNAGADIIVIETMTDLMETKAAILAAKENSDLQVMCTMTFEDNKRTFTGCSVSVSYTHLPETVSCRYNPGGVFEVCNGIMDNPGDAKYGMTPEQIVEAFKILKAKGVKNFGIHAFLASNTVTNEYYPCLLYTSKVCSYDI